MHITHTRPLSYTAFHSLRWLGALLLMAWLLTRCGGGGTSGGGPADAPLSSAKDITTFAFVKAANPALGTDAVGTVAGEGILLTLP